MAVTHPDIEPALLAAAARSVGEAGPLSLRILPAVVRDREPAEGAVRHVSYRVDGDTISQDDDPSAVETAATVIVLSAASWDQLTSQLRTVVNLHLAGDVTYERGSFGHLAAWEPALKLLHAGIPVFEPGRADLVHHDPAVTFTLDASDDELRDHLLATGFLHLRHVFDTTEIAAANAEVDRLADEARPDDDRSWWVTAADDSRVLCRLVYATQRSEGLAALAADPRVARLGRLLRADLRWADDRMEGVAVLLKAPGETAGLSNIPWHQDCGMGGHQILCPSASVGISLTGMSAATGNLRVVPGSHGQTLPYHWESQMSDVPVVEVDTEPGDVTVHVQDVMHASPQPTGEGGRRTMYVTFLPPTLWDHIGPGEAFNDLIRNRTEQAAALA